MHLDKYVIFHLPFQHYIIHYWFQKENDSNNNVQFNIDWLKQELSLILERFFINNCLMIVKHAENNIIIIDQIYEIYIFGKV